MEKEEEVEMRRRREQSLSSTARREQGEQTVEWKEVVVRAELAVSQSV